MLPPPLSPQGGGGWKCHFHSHSWVEEACSSSPPPYPCGGIRQPPHGGWRRPTSPQLHQRPDAQRHIHIHNNDQCSNAAPPEQLSNPPLQFLGPINRHSTLGGNFASVSETNYRITGSPTILCRSKATQITCSVTKVREASSRAANNVGCVMGV